MKMKVGIGYDVHQFADDRELWIGGIKIPHTRGLLGHSDADVLLHAICDAMLGAVHLKDIGTHFPDNDAAFKNIDSKILLKKTAELVASKGYKIENIDSIICAQEPKMKPYIDEMQRTIASILGIDEEDASVKATTTEKLGFVGRKEGIAAHAVVLLSKE